ncbi:MAG: beta-ketoacyl-[acyl-carrier-protein] synthase family protein, partial [Myxococcales bacterium]|nr:beta-ketoacyl-[acyl-carrier-protein] synthase family protein [Myxococcales bacterium]
MISPLGGDVPSTMRALWAGERGVRELSLFNRKGARSTLACEVVGLRENDIPARTDAMAVQAAREALRSAELDPSAVPVHLVVGGTTAGMFETEELLTQLGNIDLTSDLEVRLRTHPLSSTADQLCERVGPFASARTICCACTSGVAALALAVSWIHTGRAERVLAGGADALCRLPYSGFGCLAVLDPAACRPFDKTRAGLNLGEGAGFLVLESESAAKARGKKPLATIAGVALAGEAHHITNPEPGGKTGARVMGRALAYAGLSPRDVDYVNAHGTATPHNDAAESAAIRLCFGDERVKVSSSKGQIGHTLGAAGAIEAIIAVETAATGRIPPTIGLSEPDPACDVDHVPATLERPLPLTVMSNSFGFGGTAGSIVIVTPGVGGASSASAPAHTNELAVTGIGVVAKGRLLRGASAIAALLVEGDRETADVTGPEAAATLDVAKARRMDQAGKLSAAVIGAALEDGDDDASAPLDRANVAAISATAFGNVDGSMRFMRRVLEKGANLASPADFPSLVPSSPVSHAAIYWGLGGPALATPDLSATAESAIATGLELVASGVSTAAVAGSVEEVSQLAQRVLAPLLGVRGLSAHSEGASGVLVEPLASARARKKRPLARVTFWAAERGL